MPSGIRPSIISRVNGPGLFSVPVTSGALSMVEPRESFGFCSLVESADLGRCSLQYRESSQLYGPEI